MDHDPLDDPQLEEAYAAFGQLLAAAEMPLDEQALTARVAARVNRQVRRRRLRFAAAALAVAATLAVAVSIFRVERPGEEAVAVAAAPAAASPAIAAPPPATIADSEPIVSECTEMAAVDFAIADWDDELATETAALATAARLTEESWRDEPDALALLKSRADTLEEEITNGSL